MNLFFFASTLIRCISNRGWYFVPVSRDLRRKAAGQRRRESRASRCPGKLQMTVIMKLTYSSKRCEKRRTTGSGVVTLWGENFSFHRVWQLSRSYPSVKKFVVPQTCNVCLRNYDGGEYKFPRVTWRITEILICISETTLTRWLSICQRFERHVDVIREGDLSSQYFQHSPLRVTYVRNDDGE